MDHVNPDSSNNSDKPHKPVDPDNADNAGNLVYTGRCHKRGIGLYVHEDNRLTGRHTTTYYSADGFRRLPTPPKIVVKEHG